MLSRSDHALRAARGAWSSAVGRWSCRRAEVGGMGGERLRGVGSDPLRSPVQLGAHGSACVRACCLLMSQLLCLVSSLAPCLVRRDRERPDAVVRVRASSPLEGSRTIRPRGRESGLGSMQVPRVARGASRLCFCRVVLRYAVERKLRGTHRLYYVKTSSYGMNASGLCLSIHGTALRALARSNSRSTSKST